ncbi:MAG: hypothetical protein JRI55_11385, partial [Deltaproteobacteria bacterium]|nr:hypothetical protein [Deltaproteobacteria bacterium]
IDLAADVRAARTDKVLAVTARCRAGDGYASFASTRKPAKTTEKTPAVWTLAAAHPAARPAAPCEITVLVSASKATASESRVLGQLCWANDGLAVGACDDALLPKSGEAATPAVDAAVRWVARERPQDVDRSEHRGYELVVGQRLTHVAASGSASQAYSLRAVCSGGGAPVPEATLSFEAPTVVAGDRLHVTWSHAFSRRPDQCSLTWSHPASSKPVAELCYRAGKVTPGRCPR